MKEMNNFDFTYKMQLDSSANQYFNNARYRALDISRIKNEIDLINLKISQNDIMARLYNSKDRNSYFNQQIQLESDRNNKERQRLIVINEVAELIYSSLVNALKSLLISSKYNDSMAIMFGGNFINGIYNFINDYSLPKEVKKVFIERCSFGEVRTLIFQLRSQIPSQNMSQMYVIDNIERFINTSVY